jgi:hypothetical protein
MAYKHADWELLDVSDIAKYSDQRFGADVYAAEDRGAAVIIALHETLGFGPQEDCSTCFERSLRPTPLDAIDLVDGADSQGPDARI